MISSILLSWEYAEIEHADVISRDFDCQSAANAVNGHTCSLEMVVQDSVDCVSRLVAKSSYSHWVDALSWCK